MKSCIQAFGNRVPAFAFLAEMTILVRNEEIFSGSRMLSLDNSMHHRYGV